MTSGRCTRSRVKSSVSLAVAWAERGNADSDKKPGVIAVQIGLCHHLVRDVTRLHTAIKFIADLMTGEGRSLLRPEGDTPGGQGARKIAAVFRVGMRGRGCYSNSAQ